MSSKEDQINKIFNSKTKEEQYNLIYDYICDYIDNDLKVKNYCDFEDGKCIANRNRSVKREINGCCYIRKKGLCHHLNEGKCMIKNITCKLFFCEYLERKGVKYNLKKILPIKMFLNRKQISILKKSFFKPKEEIIKQLLELS